MANVTDSPRALAEAGDVEALLSLAASHTSSAHKIVREISRVRDSRAAQSLIRVASGEKHSGLASDVARIAKSKAMEVLGQMSCREAAPVLLETAISAEEHELRLVATMALACCGSDEHVRPLLDHTETQMSAFRDYCDLVTAGEEVTDRQTTELIDETAALVKTVTALGGSRDELTDLLSLYPEIGFQPEPREAFLEAIGAKRLAKEERIAAWAAKPSMRIKGLCGLIVGGVWAGAMGTMSMDFPSIAVIWILIFAVNGTSNFRDWWYPRFPSRDYPPKLPQQGDELSRQITSTFAGAVVCGALMCYTLSFICKYQLLSLIGIGFALMIVVICAGVSVFRTDASVGFKRNFWRGFWASTVVNGAVTLLVVLLIFAWRQLISG